MTLADGIFSPFSDTLENLYLHMDYTNPGTVQWSAFSSNPLPTTRKIPLTVFTSEPGVDGLKDGQGSGMMVNAVASGYNCSQYFCWMKQVCKTSSLQ